MDGGACWRLKRLKMPKCESYLRIMLRDTLKNFCREGFVLQVRASDFLLCAANKAMVLPILSLRFFCSNVLVKIMLTKKHMFNKL